jgi:hypothetical protein
MKQETIEEEAENSALKHFLFPKELFFKMCKCSQNYSLLEEEFGLDNTTKYREILGFIKGAKLQAERMYNEEELLGFGKSCFYKGFDKAENDDANCYTAFREEIGNLVKQFKKK